MTPSVQARSRTQVVGDIRRFLIAAETLPTPRGTALKFIELANNPNVSLQAIARIVRSDPALTGFVLRAATSARFYGMPGTIDVLQAIQRLGLGAVRTHALALSLMTQRPPRPCPHFDYDRFWAGALHTGILTESLAQRCMRRPGADTFSLGLLADIGRLAFATASPDDYGRMLEDRTRSGQPLTLSERQAFGFDHHELSSVLLADWKLPTTLAEIVYWQSDPEGSGFGAGSPNHQLSGVLQLARMLSDAVLDGRTDADTLASTALRAAILELEPHETHATLGASLPALREWARLVNLPLPAGMLSATDLVVLAGTGG